MAPTSYGDVLASNVRSARTRIGIEQESVATRMSALGFSEWARPTVSRVERGQRRVTAEEIFGLAICLQTSVTRLMSPLPEDLQVELRSGQSLRVTAVEGYVTGEWVTDARILWHEDKPFLNPGPGDYPVESA